MDPSRPRLDALAFALAIVLVAGLAIGFVSRGNGAATIMCAMCLAGLVGGRIVGLPGRVLLPVAVGLMVALWIVWIDPPASSRKTSALAHAIGGTVAGWAVVTALHRRIDDWLPVALLALTVVVAGTLVWELGEYVGDRLFGTALIPRGRDSAEDVVFGTAGGVFGITVAGGLALWRARRVVRR